MQLGAVITGDIVNSTKLNRQENKKLMQGLNALFKPFRYDFYRGDSFQVYIEDPLQALKIILKSRSLSIAIKKSGDQTSDIRCCLAIEKVNDPVRSIKTASGHAFILSGREFDAMDKDQKLSIQCNKEMKMASTAFKLMSHFIDYLFQSLTAKQALVIYEALQNHTQAEIANILKKSQATINKHMQSAGWKEIEKIMNEYEIVVNEILKSNG